MSERSEIDGSGQCRRIEASVLIRNALGMKLRADLLDVSEISCAIFTPGGRLEVGRIYTLRTPEIELLDVTAVWVKDRYAGLKFITPLNSAVAENLARMFPSKNEDLDSLLVEIFRQ